jgi:hypothetical protein
MGVCCVLYAVSDDNIAQCLADPPLVWQVVEPEDESAYLDELASQAKVPLLARLFGKSGPKPEARTLRFSAPELHEADLDKSWDGLRACLKRLAPDVPDFFEGSGSIGKVEVGYGPALYHQGETVRRIGRAHAPVSEGALLEAYRSLDHAGLYPKGLWQRQDDEVDAYLVDNFLLLRSFLQHVEQHSLGVVLRFT